MSSPKPYKPFDTDRLSFRAVRPVEDATLFNAIADDQSGFANSNISNIGLSGPESSEKFAKSLAEDYLLGAVIWLQPDAVEAHRIKVGERKGQRIEKGKEVLVSKWGHAIGEIHLSAPQKGAAHHRCTELGIDILPEYQGHGYGVETVEWALKYAFQRAGMHRVKVRALGWNHGAIRLYRERMKFVEEGCEREALWHEGQWWDLFTFGMLESEWRGQNPQTR